MDKQFIGLHPSGLAVYADPLAVQQSIEYLREEQIRAGIIPRGFHRVLTDLYGNYVLVEANSHQEAVDKYLARKTK